MNDEEVFMRIYLSIILLLLCLPLAFAAETCSSLGNPENCHEIYPEQSGDAYTYLTEYDTYILDNTDSANHYFLLMGDLSCDRSCIVPRWQSRQDTQYTTTIDLNGYTLKYSDAGYGELTNNGFEEWNGNTPLGWTVLSGSAEARDTAYWHAMTGDYVLYSADAISIESSYVNLPVANREYMAYVALGRADETDITLEVLDQNNNVVCSTRTEGFFRGKSFGCEFAPNSPGPHKMRITTSGYAYIDVTGIVPYSDYGIIAGSSYNLNSQIGDNYPGYSFTGSWDDGDLGQYNDVRPILEVKNGKITNDHENIVSYGIRTSAAPLGLIHDLNITTKGLQSHTIATGGEVYNNWLFADIPWYFARENSIEENVIVGGGYWHHNTMIGGQGVIRLRGTGTEIAHNYIRNNAQATNHYAIIHSGAVNPSIHDNVFDPIEGSGILTYVGHGYRIFNNVFYVRTATCNVEYINEDYSTNGIRMNDYGAGTNYDNWVYDNEFHITGIPYETAWSNCLPVTTGIFYSANGANNRIFGNEFYIDDQNPNDNHPVIALYVGGDATNTPEDNPLIANNYFETNDKAAWFATYYGFTENQWVENNTFVRVPNTYYSPNVPTAAIRYGRGSSDSTNNRLINNHFEGGFDPDSFQFTSVTPNGLYDLKQQWYAHVRVVDEGGSPQQGATITAVSNDGSETITTTTDTNGRATLILTEYSEAGDMTPNGVHDETPVTPHTFYVSYNDISVQQGPIAIDQETDMTIILPIGGTCSPNGATRPCGIDVGSCEPGTQTCNDGVWGACEGSVNPAEEVCNGQDDDCDGATDEYLGTTSCGLGVCAHTINNCEGGISQTCDPFEGMLVETPLLNCNNGIDENCDGSDAACGNQMTFDETATELICHITDPLGVAKVELMIDSGSGFVVQDMLNQVSDDYYFLEAESFDYDPVDWDVCPNSAATIDGNSCESDRVSATNTASALAHAHTDDNIYNGDITDMSLLSSNYAGTFSVWARSYQGTEARTWMVASDTQESSSVGGLGGGAYEWQNLDQMTFTGAVYIRDAYPDGYWAFPDLVLLTTDSGFNPATDCGVDVSVMQPQRYSLGTCGVVPTQYEARFSKPAGDYEWTCRYIDGVGETVASADCIGCGSVTPGDFNGDNDVNMEDLAVLISEFGNLNAAVNLDSDPHVGLGDLVALARLLA